MRTPHSVVARFTAVVGLLLVSVSAVVGSASAQPRGAATHRLSARHLTPRFATRPFAGYNAARIRQQIAAGTALKTWSSTVHAGDGNTYPFTLVGKNPKKAQTTPSLSVKTPVVPIILNFNSGPTFDPTVANTGCETASALTRTNKSPIFASVDYTPGGTDVGTTQYIDAFQRANLYRYTKPTGVNPGYHVLLKKVAMTAINVSVPSADSTTFGSGCTLLGAIDIDWWDSYLQTTVFPQVAAAGYGPNTFPIFLFHNVVLYIGNPNNCCVLGYHSAFTFGGGSQTYAIADYDNSTEFGPGVKDVSALAHEVGEWMDDPYVNNVTPSWGHTGQVSGCQNNLEVGDPLTGTNLTVAVNGFTYHPQELVFNDWFFENASTAVNHWFSFNDSFTSTSTFCS